MRCIFRIFLTKNPNKVSCKTLGKCPIALLTPMLSRPVGRSPFYRASSRRRRHSPRGEPTPSQPARYRYLRLRRVSCVPASLERVAFTRAAASHCQYALQFAPRQPLEKPALSLTHYRDYHFCKTSP